MLLVEMGSGGLKRGAGNLEWVPVGRKWVLDLLVAHISIFKLGAVGHAVHGMYEFFVQK